MEESLQNQNNTDIAGEKYRGPSAVISAIGHGFIEHFFYAIGGLTIGGIAAYVFHQPAAKLVAKSREAGTWLKNYHPNGNWSGTKDRMTDWAGGFLHFVFGDPGSANFIKEATTNAKPEYRQWIDHVVMNREQGFGNTFLSHTIGLLPGIGKPFRAKLHDLSPRTANAIAAGGIAGFAGYIVGWSKALFTGAKHGNEGKSQFERAQNEIRVWREKHDAVIKEKEENHKLRVSPDDPTVTPPPSAAEKETAPATAQLANAEHRGTLAAEKSAAPEIA